MTTKDACALLGVSRATRYRRLNPPSGKSDPVLQKDRVQPAALDPAERAAIIARLSVEDGADLSISQVFYRAFDEGCWIASLPSWYRIARQLRLCGDRRRQAKHPPKAIPVLSATGPNQVWSWDITTFASIDRGRNFKLYVILDVFSRYVVAWRLEDREEDDLAVEMFRAAIAEHGIPQVLHADRGSVMTSDVMSKILADHGVTQSHSRPHVSNDNPFSEAQFKTTKYDLGYPIRFTDIDHARAWTAKFIGFYNGEHRHSGIGYYTPASVHHGTWTHVRDARQTTLDRAHEKHPERFAHAPKATTISTTVWINEPQPVSQTG